MSDSLLTVAEVAKRLKCHPHTVRRWIWARRLHAVKVGDLVRVPQEEVEKLMRPMPDEHAAQTGAAALLAAARKLKGTVDPADMNRVENYIAEAEQPVDWTSPLA